MAKCEFNVDDDFMKQLEKLGNSEEVMKKILEETAPIIVEEEKKRLSKHSRTGEMVNSIKATKVKENKWGHYVVVRPTGNSKTYIDEKGNVRQRKNKVRNMEKLIYTEYGKSGQAADPVQQQTVNATKDKIAEKAQEVFNREVGL